MTANEAYPESAIPYFTRHFAAAMRERKLGEAQPTGIASAFNNATLLATGLIALAEVPVMNLCWGADSPYMDTVHTAIEQYYAATEKMIEDKKLQPT